MQKDTSFHGFLVSLVVIYIGSTPHPVTITTRIITSLVGNLYKPSVMKTTMNQSFVISFVEMLLELEKKSEENHFWSSQKNREHNFKGQTSNNPLRQESWSCSSPKIHTAEGLELATKSVPKRWGIVKVKN